MSSAVNGNRKTNDDDILGWDATTGDATKRIEDLKFSIKLFEKTKGGWGALAGQFRCQASSLATQC